MKRRMRRTGMVDDVFVKGFFKLQIIDKKTKKIVGDSGMCKNTVTNKGLNDMCAGAVINAAGSVQAETAILATQSTAVDATQVSLLGTVNTQQAVTPSTVATGTGRMTCSFDGADLTASPVTIGAVGLHFTNTVTNSMLAGQTYTTSQFTSDQDVNVTYELRFA